MLPGVTFFRKEMVRIAMLVILAASVRIFFILKYDNTMGSPAGNVVESLRIVEDPSFSLNFNPGCSTLYNYAVASFMFFWRDPVWAPKIFTLVFGIFLVLPYYGTIKVLFNQRIAFFSSCILAFYPLHIQQSISTTANALYYFFIFSSFYYFFRYKYIKEDTSSLLIAALFFNIAALLRFECWVFIPVLSLLLWDKGKVRAAFFLALLSIAPSIYLWVCQIYFHNALYSFQTPANKAYADIAAGSSIFDPGFWSWLFVLWRHSGPSIVVAGLSGVVFAFFFRQGLGLVPFFIISFLVLSINSYIGRLLQFPYYSVFCGLLLIPYAAFFIDRGLMFFKQRIKLFYLLFLIFPMVDFCHMDFFTMSSMSADNVLCHQTRTVAEWLKKHVSAGKSGVLFDADPYDVYPQGIALQSGIAPSRCMFIYSRTFDQSFKDAEAFRHDIENGRFEYLVLHSKGQIQKVLKLHVGNERIDLGRVYLKAVFDQDFSDGGKYFIYKVCFQAMRLKGAM